MKRLHLSILMVCVMATAAHYTLGAEETHQTDSIRTLIANTIKFNRLFPQEKVYLHLNDNGYFIGERIWMKAYVMRADSNRLSDLSRVLYVEPVTPSGEVMERRKLEIKNGEADGDILLDKIVMSGFYELRAYTRYMTNWGTDGSFSRVIPIYNKPAAEGDYTQMVICAKSYRNRLPDYREVDSVKIRRMNVRFFPEGGKIIRGIRGNVAFDVTNSAGRHVDTEGYLVQGKDTTAVKTFRDGRGVMKVQAEDAVPVLWLKDEDGKRSRFDLPPAAAEGCGMSVNTQQKDEVTVELNATKALQNELVGIAIMHNGYVTDCDTATLERGTVTKTVKKDKMKDGVNQLTVFDANGEILGNRMCFIYPRQKCEEISISVDNKYLQPCKKIAMQVRTIPNATFSISVKDADTQTNGCNQNAMTWMLLSSDLKGYIENPAYYLESNDDKHQRAADLLMMVQGWKRYDFKMMEGRRPFYKRQPIEDNLYLDGRLHKARKSANVEGVDLSVFLYNHQGNVIKGKTKTKENGFYAFRIPYCTGNWNMPIKTRMNDKAQRYYVGIDRNFSPAPRRLSFYESQALPVDTPRIRFDDTQNDDREWPMNNNNFLLKEIKVKGHYQYSNATAVWNDEAHGAWKASIYYDCDIASDTIADRGEDTPGFLEWLCEKNKFFDGDRAVDGMGGMDDKEHANIYADGLSYKNRPIIWVVDNKFYSGTSFRHLNQKNARTTPQIVATADQWTTKDPFPNLLEEAKAVFISEDENIWLRYAFAPSFEGQHPVTVFVYTHDLMAKQIKGWRRTHFEGYNQPTDFSSTTNDYSLMAPQPDYRRTLYWNPNVSTDKSGRTRLEFYNNSTCKRIVISAEGITSNGKAMIY